MPGSLAVSVVVPSAFAVSIPVAGSKWATNVSLSSQFTRTSASGVESAASATALNCCFDRTGSWMVPPW